MIKIVALLVLQSFSFASYADIYKWTDKNGATHYSDRDTTDVPVEVIEDKVDNSFSYTPNKAEIDNVVSQIDTYRLPHHSSNIPFKFILTSGMNLDKPIDRLSSIDINQRSFHSFVSLNGIERDTLYNFRIRILDAKEELIFDKDLALESDTNSMLFVTTISPNVNIDTPGQWTFQGILNNKRLFVQKRGINF